MLKNSNGSQPESAATVEAQTTTIENTGATQVRKKSKAENTETATDLPGEQASGETEGEIDYSIYTFEQLKELMQKYADEDNISELRKIENFILEYQKLIQEEYKRIVSASTDGKVGFEIISRTVRGKEYSYTRAYWKENGVKKGKLLPPDV